jgi:hypothetical protein
LKLLCLFNCKPCNVFWIDFKCIIKKASDSIDDEKIKKELDANIQIIDEKLTKYKTS